MSGITKVWVRRPNSSPTRIHIPSSISTPIFSPSTNASSPRDGPQHVDVELTEDFLIDDLREAILRKYPQSLGKHHDAADLSIRIPLRRQNGGGNGDLEAVRLLSPDESVLKILREEYPNGQKSSEAWTIITTGGRDNYTKWWLQTGGYSIDTLPLRGAYSPNQFIPTTGGSFGSEVVHQEYFPLVPQTVVTPPSEFPPRSKTSGSSMISGSQYARPQGRPPLRGTRTTPQEGSFPGRRFDNTNTSSMIVEAVSGAESEVSRPPGRGSPDTNALSGIRYPNIRPSSSLSGQSTPGTEYPNRVRQYAQGNKQSTPVPGQTFQMQLPLQALSAIPQKAQSPLGGPPTYPQRLPQGSGTRPTISTIVSSSPTIPVEKPPIQPKGTTSPKSPGSGYSPNSAGTTSPVTRRKSNTITSQSSNIPITRSQSPPPAAGRTDSPRPARGLPLIKSKSEKETAQPKNSSLAVIPPINVLIVEDNIINAQILEVFFRKRKLKYATAVNGKEAVEKWRLGGWHLVLMDIQLPVMSGIEATKEIRRLERVNRIGVFLEESADKPCPEDELGDLLFPSPVIIVALTASSRESDRNEALAAGCNDFLTKPVGAPWLERKAIEWGCMQALIWTSLERKKRRESDVEKVMNGNISVAQPELEKKNEGVNGEVMNDEKPPGVARGDSGDSVKTKDSGSTDESQGN